jgi:hypothetical protein
MKEKISQLTNVVEFNVVDLDHDMDLLMSDKKGLSNEDLIGIVFFLIAIPLCLE